MAKGTYIGVNNVARKVKKMYVGVGGVARKVKKGYIGVNGVARLFYQSGVSFINHEVLSLSWNNGRGRTGVGHYNGVSFNNKAAFVNGRTGPYSDNVTKQLACFDESLTFTTPVTDLPATGSTWAGVNNYIVFATAENMHNLNRINNTVRAISNTFTLTTCTGLPLKAWEIGVGSLSQYVLFGGGYYRGNYETAVMINTYAYDNSLTLKSAADLSVARSVLTSATTKDYMIFAGGATGTSNPEYGDTTSAAVEAYNSSLTKNVCNNLSVSRYTYGAGTVSIAFFGGGGSYNYSTGRVYNTVDTYNNSLTKSTATGLNVARTHLQGAALGDVALFAGGHNSTTDTLSTYSGGTTYYSTVEGYDASLVKTAYPDLHIAGGFMSSAHTSSKIIFGGSYTSGTSNYDKVDVYNFDV